MDSAGWQAGNAFFIKSSGLLGGRGSGWIALPLLPCENSWSGKQVSWTSLIQRQHNITDSFDAHASGESPTSLLGSQNTSHTQDLACSGLSLNG